MRRAVGLLLVCDYTRVCALVLKSFIRSCLSAVWFHSQRAGVCNMSGVIRGPAGSNDCRIYVGNLPPDIRTKDVEDVFYKYGAIRDIDLKNRRGGPPFAFVEFEDPR